MDLWLQIVITAGSVLATAVASPFVWNFLSKRLGLRREQRREDIVFINDTLRELVEMARKETEVVKRKHKAEIAAKMRWYARYMTLKARHEPHTAEEDSDLE